MLVSEISYRYLLSFIFVMFVHCSPVSHQRNYAGTFRIVNGTYAAITQFPYLVSIQRKRHTAKKHICGGAFISERWILTAAHCLDGETAQGLIIRAESTFHNRGGTLLKVAKLIKHHLFAPENDKDYDYGLVQLEATFHRAVPAVLKAGSKRIPPGQLCKVMGWGTTSSLSSTSSRRVMQVSVPIVKQSDCRSAYKTIDTLTPRMICAGYREGGKDACEGDSGGPFICKGILVGITSWAEGCAESKYYGVYSYITPVRSWIRNITGV